MFEFGFGEVDLVALDIPPGSSEPVSAPADLYDVIGTDGDRFRDWFTRMCLYMVGRSRGAPREAVNQVIVVGTEYGNTSALLGLQRAAASQGRRLSPQYFPVATSSSAAALLSMRIGATGGNHTVNAGLLTPIMAFWQALCGLSYPESSGSRLLVGDIYCAEAHDDAAKETPELECGSGLMHVCLTADSEFEARFEFGTPHDGREVTRDRYDRNGAFSLTDLLRAARHMQIGESVGMECRGVEGPHGRVVITRLSEPRDTTEWSGR